MRQARVGRRQPRRNYAPLIKGVERGEGETRDSSWSRRDTPVAGNASRETEPRGKRTGDVKVPKNSNLVKLPKMTAFGKMTENWHHFFERSCIAK